MHEACCFFFQAEDGIRDLVRSRGLGDVYKRQDVQRAIANVDGPIAAALRGRDALDQAGIDALLVALDGTRNKAVLGGNATVAVSPPVGHGAARRLL